MPNYFWYIDPSLKSSPGGGTYHQWSALPDGTAGSGSVSVADSYTITILNTAPTKGNKKGGNTVFNSAEHLYTTGGSGTGSASDFLKLDIQSTNFSNGKKASFEAYTLNWGGSDGNDTINIALNNSITYNLTLDPGGAEYGVLQLYDAQGDELRFYLSGFSEINIVCFTEKTRILTPQGEKRVETLRVGDLVLTADHGPQPIRWIGKRTYYKSDLRLHPEARPIKFRKNALGNERALSVSPQHRIFVDGPKVAALTGEETGALTPAKHLVNGKSVIVDTKVEEVSYYHLFFDRHELIWANGALAESLYPGKVSLSTLAADSRREFLKLFPNLNRAPEEVEAQYGPKARRVLKRREVQTFNIAPTAVAAAGRKTETKGADTPRPNPAPCPGSCS